MKLFQLMVEHSPDEENIDWTKIEPSVNFLKSPKGTCLTPILARAWAAWGGAGLAECLWSICFCPVVAVAVAVAWGIGSAISANE